MMKNIFENYKFDEVFETAYDEEEIEVVMEDETEEAATIVEDGEGNFKLNIPEEPKVVLERNKAEAEKKAKEEEEKKKANNKNKNKKDEEVKVAKKVHGIGNGKGYSEDIGWKELKRYPVKVGKRGGKFVNIGIRANVTATQKKKELADASAGVKRATHWDKVKGLWFNNYGFYHNKTGKYVAGSNWIETAYQNSVEGAYEKVREIIEKDLGL